MNILYINQKAQKSKQALIFLFAFMSIFSFEGLRAGLLTHLNGVTPKLFGIVNTSPINPQTALHWIIPFSLILFIVFFYMLIKAIWRGVLLNLTLEDKTITALYNGLSKKKLSYDINKIKKISYKTEISTIGVSATVPASGTATITERLYIYIQNENKKLKKINLVSGEKDIIHTVGKEIKAQMSS